MQCDSATICNDNKFLTKEIVRDIVKESECTQEEGAVVEVMWREMKSSKLEIKVLCSNDKPRKQDTFFYQKLGPMLMKRCDREAKRKCTELSDNRHETNVKYMGIATPKIREETLDESTSVFV